MRKRNRIAALFALAATALFFFSATGSVVAPLPGTGINGYVTDVNSGLPISGATVSCGSPYPMTKTTDANGFYNLAPLYAYGTYTVTASKTDYVTQSKQVTVVYRVATPKVNLALAPAWGVYGWVKDETGSAVSQAKVSLYYSYFSYYEYYASANGYYWYHQLTNVLKVNAWKFGYWDASSNAWVASKSSLVRKDFTIQKDTLSEITVGAIYSTVNWAHTSVVMTLDTGYGQSTKVTCTLGGSGGSKTTSLTVTQAYLSGTSNTCLIIKEQCWITGSYDMIAKKVIGSWIREYTGYRTWKTDWTDYYSKYSIDVSGMTTKGHIQQIPKGVGGYKVGALADGSITYQLGLSLSIGAYGVSVPFELVGSWTGTKTTSLYTSISNNDGVSHDYKWWLEGSSAKGGLVLHVWEM